MTYSRVALSLLLAVLGGSILALELGDSHRRVSTNSSRVAPTLSEAASDSPSAASLLGESNFSAAGVASPSAEAMLMSFNDPIPAYARVDPAQLDGRRLGELFPSRGDEFSSQNEWTEAYYQKYGHLFASPHRIYGSDGSVVASDGESLADDRSVEMTPYEAAKIHAIIGSQWSAADRETADNSAPPVANSENNAATSNARNRSGYLELYHGEPGEIFGKSIDDEPLCYNYVDPSEYDRLDYYSSEVRQAIDAERALAEKRQETQSDLELFADSPADLLTANDEQLIVAITNESLSDRREAIDEYLCLGELGPDAAEFADQFKAATGLNILDMTDNLPAVAAFLGSYRLLERGELGMQESVDLLRRSLTRLSPQWTNHVQGIAAKKTPLVCWSETATEQNESSDALIPASFRHIGIAVMATASQMWNEFLDTARTASIQIDQRSGLSVLNATKVHTDTTQRMGSERTR
jgi:hypothetical protein